MNFGKLTISEIYPHLKIIADMYGFRLNGTKYVTTTYAKWSTNVGDDFNKTFGKDIETSYTPGNFFTYWASYKIPQKIAQGKKNIPKDLYDLLSLQRPEYIEIQDIYTIDTIDKIDKINNYVTK